MNSTLETILSSVDHLVKADQVVLITRQFRSDRLFDQLLQNNKYKNVFSAQSEPFANVLDLLNQNNLPLTIICPHVSIILNNIPTILKLRHYPVVIHLIANENDYHKISDLKNLGCPILLSSNQSEAIDFSVAAQLMATLAHYLVIHVSEYQFSHNIPSSNPSELYISVSEYLKTLKNNKVNEFNAQDAKSQSFKVKDQDECNILLQQVFDLLKANNRAQYSSLQLLNSCKPNHVKYAVLLYGYQSSTIVGDNEKNSDIAFFKLNVLRPWPQNLFHSYFNKFDKLEKLFVVERISVAPSTKWGPLYLDVLSDPSIPSKMKIYSVSLQATNLVKNGNALNVVLKNHIESPKPEKHFRLRSVKDDSEDHTEKEIMDSKSLEYALQNPYFKMLDSLFGSALFLTNRDLVLLDQTQAFNNPELAVAALQKRQREFLDFERIVSDLLKDQTIDNDLKKLLAKWLEIKTVKLESDKVSNDIINHLILLKSDETNSKLSYLNSKKHHFFRKTFWIICSDEWAHDVGNGGLVALLRDEPNINLLIIETKPTEVFKDSAKRKKDIGLFAMNWGNAFVASIAAYGNYTQAICSLEEANAFNGPSVITAFLPFYPDDASPIETIKETKKAIESGYWPLYRFNPLESEDKIFIIDSERIRRELKAFLDEQNTLSQVSLKLPNLSLELGHGEQEIIRMQLKEKAKIAYHEFLDSLSGTPITILFGSDGGTAESVAKRLGLRAASRGLKPVVSAMDEFPFDDLTSIEHLILVVSTAGQGETPQNAREFYEALKNATDLDLSSVKFAVFGMGDSNYWPRKEDKHYYNKPGKDFDRILFSQNAQRLIDLGLGDEQDPDGYETGYLLWEDELWTALGATSVLDGAVEVKPPTNEDIKIESNYLRGTIAQGLEDLSTGRISESDTQLTKFHGTYMQDDRDIRDQRKAMGIEPAYSFMIRVRLTGGVCTPKQWLQMNEISDKLGIKNFKLTTRQTFQFHGIVKSKLRPAMQAINKAFLTTLGACGDVNRNVLVASVPVSEKLHDDVYEVARQISDHLLPHTNAYHEIWLVDSKLKKHQVSGSSILLDKNDYSVEPLYGPTYLPRKFKVNIAIPPHNDVDVYSIDVGLIAIINNSNELEGFNVLVGGGMGATRNNKNTYPNAAQCIGYVPKHKAVDITEKIMLTQRDLGDRANRKHARLKYTVDTFGLQGFKKEVELRYGESLEDERPYEFVDNIDKFGWFTTKGVDGKDVNHFGMFIENGRVEGIKKEGLKKIAGFFKGEFRLTANQHLYLSQVPENQINKIKQIMKTHNLDQVDFTGLRLASSACVALPTCGLAMAESERYLPLLISKVESLLDEFDLSKDSIVMRMSGCPNGCSRPYLAEIALVGKSLGVYDMYLGGGYQGQRLNKLYKLSVDEEQIIKTLKPIFKAYALERFPNERLGDFTIRKGFVNETKKGLDFHDNIVLHETDEEDDE